jgi:excinuclease ABC subunit B
MYADTITRSMKSTIDETNRRRAKQEKYNKDNNITPTQVVNESRNLLIDQSRYATDEQEDRSKFILQEPILAKMSPKQLSAAIELARRNMEQAAKELDFLRAAQFRDEMYELKKLSSKQ